MKTVGYDVLILLMAASMMLGAVLENAIEDLIK